MFSTLYLAVLLTVLGTFAMSEDPGNCPDYTDKVCPFNYKINDCCAQSDCPSYAICCIQPCGNVCRRRAEKPIGTPFVDGTKCEIGHVFPKAWYQKLWDNISSGRMQI
uniref:Secretory peptide n=1 Tax=Heteropoda venatoria TaxID=152925 RepID=A0A088BPB6_HETVE|nr:secretory peptide [Heteropoda venatoria]